MKDSHFRLGRREEKPFPGLCFMERSIASIRIEIWLQDLVCTNQTVQALYVAQCWIIWPFVALFRSHTGKRMVCIMCSNKAEREKHWCCSNGTILKLRLYKILQSNFYSDAHNLNSNRMFFVVTVIRRIEEETWAVLCFQHSSKNGYTLRLRIDECHSLYKMYIQ